MGQVERMELPCDSRTAGLALKALRTEQHLTTIQFGKKLGTRPGAVTNRELHGLATLRAVQDYFNTLGYDVSLVLTRRT